MKSHLREGGEGSIRTGPFASGVTEGDDGNMSCMCISDTRTA
jgi:hypothetical protein